MVDVKKVFFSLMLSLLMLSGGMYAFNETSNNAQLARDISVEQGREVERRLATREELDRLMIVLKKRKESLDNLSELEGRNDVQEIERVIREEIDEVLFKIQRLATELNEGNIEEISDEKSSQWVTVMLTCSTLWCLSVLALALLDPYAGLQLPPTIKQFETNLNSIANMVSW